MTASKVDGVDDAGIAEALAEWPGPVRSSASWDAAAARLLARIVEATSKVSLTAPAWQEETFVSVAEEANLTSSDGFDAEWDSVPADDDAVFLPPLPRAPEEPLEHAAALDPAERRSGSVSPPMEGRPDADLAAESLDGETFGTQTLDGETLDAEARASAPSPFRGGLGRGEDAHRNDADPQQAGAEALEHVPVSTLRTSTRPPPPAPGASIDLGLVVTAASVTPPPMALAPPRRVGIRRAAFLGGLGVMATAACAFLLLKTRAPAASESEMRAAGAATTLESTASAATPSAGANPSPEAMRLAEAPPAAAQAAGAGDAYATGATGATGAGDDKPSHHAAKKGTGRAGALSNSANSVNKKSAKSGKQDAAGSSGESQSAMRIAAAPTDSPGTTPQKPANGAVQAALSAVLPKARACLRKDDDPSHANLVFDSSGKVQNVTVEGPALGKLAETCIKNALKPMKLPPFAEPKFSTIVTVRPR